MAQTFFELALERCVGINDRKDYIDERLLEFRVLEERKEFGDLRKNVIEKAALTEFDFDDIELGVRWIAKIQEKAIGHGSTERFGVNFLLGVDINRTLAKQLFGIGNNVSFRVFFGRVFGLGIPFAIAYNGHGKNLATRSSAEQSMGDLGT